MVCDNDALSHHLTDTSPYGSNANDDHFIYIYVLKHFLGVGGGGGKFFAVKYACKKDPDATYLVSMSCVL